MATWSVDPSAGSRKAERLRSAPRIAVGDSARAATIAAATSALAVEGLSMVTRDGEWGARAAAGSNTVIAEDLAVRADGVTRDSARGLGDKAEDLAASPDVDVRASPIGPDPGKSRTPASRVSAMIPVSSWSRP